MKEKNFKVNEKYLIIKCTNCVESHKIFSIVSYEECNNDGAESFYEIKSVIMLPKYLHPSSALHRTLRLSITRLIFPERYDYLNNLTCM
jgi:hypothetical protein